MILFSLVNYRLSFHGADNAIAFLLLDINTKQWKGGNNIVQIHKESCRSVFFFIIIIIDVAISNTIL